MHTVADVSCAHCNTMLGWVYVRAEAEDQKYKEGKLQQQVILAEVVRSLLDRGRTLERGLKIRFLNTVPNHHRQIPKVSSTI